MPRTHCLRSLTVILAGVMLTPTPYAVAQQATNPAAAAIAEFNKQVAAYMDLHKKAEGSIPAVPKEATPAEVTVFEKALAESIKAARPMAKQGDVFSAGVVPIFKKSFSNYHARRNSREQRLLFDEVPNFQPQVNMAYPAGLPKATFPPRLALSLPQLPNELEYRVVGTNLVLRDSEANLIVDFIPDVLPPSTAGAKK